MLSLSPDAQRKAGQYRFSVFHPLFFPSPACFLLASFLKAVTIVAGQSKPLFKQFLAIDIIGFAFIELGFKNRFTADCQGLFRPAHLQKIAFLFSDGYPESFYGYGFLHQLINL